MLLIIAAILFILWLIGIATAFTVGGLIHLLLIAAIILVLIRIFRGSGGDGTS